MPIRKEPDRGQGDVPASTAPSEGGGATWPAVNLADVKRLDDILQRACEADSLEALGILVTPLHEICQTSFGDRSRSPWECLAAWAANREVPGLVRARIAYFSSLWNENIRQQAYGWGLAVGYPSEDQVARIESGALEACAELDPSLPVAHDENVSSFQRELAARRNPPANPR
jgi:hypothetical protein